MSIIGTLPNTTSKSSLELARERNRRWYWKNPEKTRFIKREAKRIRELNLTPEALQVLKKKQSQQQKDYRLRHRESLLEKKRIYYAKNREMLQRAVRIYRAAKKYSSTPEALDEMLRSQGSACAICGTLEPNAKNPWHVDHDHSTGKVRGILCHQCNTGMGQMNDDPIRLRKAAEYLEKSRA